MNTTLFPEVLYAKIYHFECLLVKQNLGLYYSIYKIDFPINLYIFLLTYIIRKRIFLCISQSLEKKILNWGVILYNNRYTEL